MAIKNESLHYATENLILPTPRKYYSAQINTNHWQLRSLISTSNQDNVYYPSGNEIVRLNTKTCEREIITTLSFSPRCLASSSDWVCCGGEDGNYVAVSLDERKRRSPRTFPPDADPDARLPFDLEPITRAILRETSVIESLAGFPRSRGPLLSKTKKVGKEIVNCITLWSPTPNSSEKAYKIPVAVVSNNDHSVSFLDVTQSEVIEELTLPDCANRSVMSPDGELLVTICDDPFLYIHERVEKKTTSIVRKSEARISPNYEWVMREPMILEGQKVNGDKRDTLRGSFAASFSISGKYLAVATQYGLITIFDATSLTRPGVDSVLTIFTSSRPGSGDGLGAVRAMEFSPGVFDLLAWTEASGRIGVADMRNLCLSRQRLAVDSRSEGVERIIATERSGLESVSHPRPWTFRADSPSTSSTTPDYLGLDSERRQSRNITREMWDRHQTPLTIDELQVLQAHRLARRQRDAVLIARQPSAEASTSRSGPSGDDQGSSASTARTRSDERRISSFSMSNLPPALREFVNSDRSPTSIRSYINDRNQDRERRTLDMETRRVNLIQLAAAESALDGARTGNSTSSDVATAAPAPTTASGPRLPAIESIPPSNPWAELDALYRARFGNDPTRDTPVDRSTRIRVETEEDRRDFANRLRQPWRLTNDVVQLASSRDEYVSTNAHSRFRAGITVETMGCSWSQDGRILYIGAEDGIHEYHVNISARKKFPSLVLR